MYKSKEFSIEIWPGEIRIHQNYEEEGMQTIELTADQIEDFCVALKRHVAEAKALGEEMERHENSRLIGLIVMSNARKSLLDD